MPTSTDMTDSRVPVAVTDSLMDPVVTVSVTSDIRSSPPHELSETIAADDSNNVLKFMIGYNWSLGY